MVKISIAGGQRVPKGFVGMDLVKLKDVKYVGDILDFGKDSVWKKIKDNSVDEYECSHFIEHIPHGNGYIDPFFKFFDEVYRTLKPAKFSKDNPNIPTSGFAKFVTPYYSSMRAFQDPTHIRHITDMTLYYLDKEWRKVNGLDHYKVKCDFKFNAYYVLNARLQNRNQEFVQNAILTQWNAVDDLAFTVWKIK